MTSNIYKSDDLFLFYHQLSELAKKIGIETSHYVLARFEKEIRMVYRKNRDILKLKVIFKSEKLEKACARANYYKKQSVSDLIWLLKNGLEELPLEDDQDFFGQKHLNFE